MLRPRRGLMPYLFAPLLLLAGVGCSQSKLVTISTQPPDAIIKIDGIERGRGKLTEEFVFRNSDDTHVVTISRLGFKEQAVPITRDFARSVVPIELKPLTRDVRFTLTMPGYVVVDGKRVTPEPVSTYATQLEFTVDERNNWTTHKVRAERPGYKADEKVVSWMDRDASYVLNLELLKKTLRITSKPPGATVTINDQQVGTTPYAQEHAFPPDPDTGEVSKQKVVVEKPGYPPVEKLVGWDEGVTDYPFDLTALSKDVRIVTDPPGATVVMDGAEVQRDDTGVSRATLSFPPVDDAGNLRTYTAKVSKQPAPEDPREWEPAELTIGWQEGQSEYAVALKEILTVNVPLLAAAFERGPDGWEPLPKWTQTLAMKAIGEGGAKRPAPTQITTQLTKGSIIDSFSVAPDGSNIVFSNLLAGQDKNDFRAQLMVVRTDGSGGMDFFSDGKSLDLMPAYTPGGDEILYASNRTGRHHCAWSMPANGAPGLEQLTASDFTALWPVLDADPKPRLWYQALLDNRPETRLFVQPRRANVFKDLGAVGAQPRVSPLADAVLYTVRNDKTGKRDIYRIPDSGGTPQNLTNTPDVDEFDAAWNRNGSRIAFASDRGFDGEKRRNYDIWVMDSSTLEVKQITTNGSHDDCPVWDPLGNALYFRSNRGGDWNIWRLMLD